MAGMKSKQGFMGWVQRVFASERLEEQKETSSKTNGNGKVMVSYRFNESTRTHLAALAKLHETSQTKILEQLINQAWADEIGK